MCYSKGHFWIVGDQNSNPWNQNSNPWNQNGTLRNSESTGSQEGDRALLVTPTMSLQDDSSLSLYFQKANQTKLTIGYFLASGMPKSLKGALK